MKSFRDLSVRSKLLLSGTIASGASLLLVGALVTTHDVMTLRKNLVRRTAIQADIVGTNSLSALLFNDQASAEATLAALAADPHLVAAALYTDDRRLFAAYRREPSASPDLLEPDLTETGAGHRLGSSHLTLARPIQFNKQPLGTLVLVTDLGEIRASLARDVMVFASVLALSLLLALAVASGLQRGIAGPILRLAATARRVSTGKDYSVRAEAGSGDEIGTLVASFNDMLEEIRRRDAELRNAHDLLEQRVRERTAQLEDANRELEAFTYSVSHDLRAPLRHIAGFAEMLGAPDGDPGGNGGRYAQKIAGAAARMGDLIDDLLVFSRMGRTELQATDVDLGRLAGDVVRECEQDGEPRRIEWQVGRLPVVHGDRSMLRLALVNLVSNAVKYSGKRDTPRIEIGAEEGTDREVVVFVRDNGVGFDMKYAAKLFGVFQRLHRADEFEGTGIGLANVRRIIHRHGGRTWAEGEPGRGAVFYFSLPGREEVHR